jgi:LacI family transcriptional regulator, galactose operon repressor
MGVTVKDVAQAAGVSQATAARALGGYGYVSATSRRVIEDAARSLGYRRHAVAQALASNVTHTVGLVVSDIENPFFAAVARGLSDVLEAESYTILLANSDEDLEREERLVEAFRSRRVDGLAVAPSVGSSIPHLADLVSADVPLVLFDRPVRGLKVDVVLVDNRQGARTAVKHLLRLGHKRIGLVSDPPEIASSAERIQGYRAALEEAGLLVDERLIALTGSTQADGYNGARALMEQRRRPSAIFTANNMMSVGTLLALRDLGLRIPDDVALVGFDDLEWTTLIEPPLTVVRQPVQAIGRQTAERLLARMRGDRSQPRRIRLATEFVVRGSCGENR